MNDSARFPRTLLSAASACLTCLLLPLPVAGAQGKAPVPARWRAVPQMGIYFAGGMAYDPLRKRVVRFGGGWHGLRATTETGVTRAETWEWDGKVWELKEPAHRPAARSGLAMAWDPVSQKVLLFGGGDGQNVLPAETWAWDGQDWTLLKPKNSPSPRLYPSMATDPVRKRLVLFGGALSYDGFVSGMQPQDDTWEWNGTDWVRMNPKTVPDKRLRAGMAWCSLSKSIVMHGGAQGFAAKPPRNTWEWSGSDWTKYSPATYPDDGDLVALPTTGKVAHLRRTPQDMLEVWEWDGKAWTVRLPNIPFGAMSPLFATDEGAGHALALGFTSIKQPRDHLATWAWDGSTLKKLEDRDMVVQWLDDVVHDPVRDRVYGFGGAVSGGFATWYLDDKGHFVRLFPKNSPPIRNYFHVLWHEGLQKVWLFGGTTTTTLSDVWLWDGTDWSFHSNIKPPKDLLFSDDSYCYDPHRDKVVAVSSKSETWEWDAKSGWAMRSPKTQPPPGGPALAYDPVRRKVVMAGGFTLGAFSSAFQTWEWDGTDWTQVQTAHSPLKRGYHRMEYVPALGGMVLFGGLGNITLAGLTDTWIYDGKDWREPDDINPYVWTNGIYSQDLVSTYDRNRQRVVAAMELIHLDRPWLWELSFPTLSTSQPYPRPGESLSLQAELPVDARKPFILLLSGATRPGIPLKPLPGGGYEMLPLALDPLLVASLGAGFVTVLDSEGKGSLPIQIPNDSTLIGVPFYCAGVAYRGNQTFGSITNAVFHEIVQ